jgi:transcriptional regulator of NAD metabolism
MNRAQRLEAIKGILEEATSPVSGSYLAELFGVSRVKSTFVCKIPLASFAA